MNKGEVLARLEEMGAAPKRALGQNFLVSENVISKIIEAVEKTQPQWLVEIGPGLGSLTEKLKDFPLKKLLLIELDAGFAAYWRDQGFEVLEQDALKVDWEMQDWSREHLVLVSNLPYQISASLVMELSSLKAPLFESMILMFQKEVAERITAKPKTKDYGSLSVVAQNRWKVKKVVDAAPACFHPRPQIASRVLRFDLMEEGVGHPKFLKFVRQGFQNRRKLLIKSLKGIDAQFDWSKKLEDLGHASTARAEELGPEDWKKLFNEYQDRCGQ